MARSKKSKAGSRMEAVAEAVNALSARPLEEVIRLPGPGPEGTRLERRLINTVLATDKTTVIKIYREEPARDNADTSAANSRTADEDPIFKPEHPSRRGEDGRRTMKDLESATY